MRVCYPKRSSSPLPLIFSLTNLMMLTNYRYYSIFSHLRFISTCSFLVKIERQIINVYKHISSIIWSLHMAIISKSFLIVEFTDKIRNLNYLYHCHQEIIVNPYWWCASHITWQSRGNVNLVIQLMINTEEGQKDTHWMYVYSFITCVHR